MSNFGPTRSDLRFRLVVSVAGMAFLIVAIGYRGLPTTPGGWEAIGLATVFFGGTFVWTVRKLVRKDHSEGH